MKVSFFKALGMVGMLAEELTEALADNKISIPEAIKMVARISGVLGVELHGKDLLFKGIEDLTIATKDGVITTNELVNLLKPICEALNIKITIKE